MHMLMHMLVNVPTGMPLHMPVRRRCATSVAATAADVYRRALSMAALLFHFVFFNCIYACYQSQHLLTQCRHGAQAYA